MPHQWLSLVFRQLHRGRILFLFVFFVLLPLLPLVYLVSLTIGGDQQKTSREIGSHLERVGQDFARMFNGTIRDCEEDLFRELNERRSRRELLESLADPGDACPLFKDCFVIDSGLRRRFPFPPADREFASILEAAAIKKSQSEFAENLVAGTRGEFRDGDLDSACAGYRRAMGSAGDSVSRLLALQALARCSYKRLDYRVAQDYYREILAGGPSGISIGGLSLELLARFRLAQLEERLFGPERAFPSYLEIIERLAGGLGAGSVHEASFYAAMIQDAVGELRVLGALDRKGNEEFDRTWKAWEERRDTALALGRLQEMYGSDLWRSGDTDRRAGEIADLMIVPGKDEEAALVSWRFSDPESGDPLLMTALFRPDQVLAAVKEAVRGISEIGEDVNLAVSDGDGETVAGFGDPDANSRYELTRSLEPLLPGWNLHLAYRRDGTLLEQNRNLRRNRFTYISFLVLIIVLGLYVTHRLIKKDAELARLKSDFVSRVSHELRTPLATIRALGEMLEMGAVSSREKEREYFSFITSESERLSRLIDNVLNFSKIEARKKRYDLRAGDISRTVADTVRAFRGYSKADGFEIRYRADEPVPPVAIDADAVSEALINLLDNAIKFSGESRVVLVRLTRRGDEVRISVADQGIGIAREKIGRIFEEFFSLPEDGNLSGKGAGLGLAIVKHIVEAHGGRVEVESSPGRGTIFTIVIPISRPGSGKPAGSPRERNRSRSGKGAGTRRKDRG